MENLHVELELVSQESNKSSEAVIVLNMELSQKDDFIAKLQQELKEAHHEQDSNRLQVAHVRKATRIHTTYSLA
jgi:hypothetical protein